MMAKPEEHPRSEIDGQLYDAWLALKYAAALAGGTESQNLLLSAADLTELAAKRLDCPQTIAIAADRSPAAT